MKKIAAVLAVVGALVVSGCVSDPVQFRKCDMTNATVLGEAEGKATGIMLFNFIPINQNDRFEDAYQDAIRKRGGTCIVDPVIQEKWFWAYLLNGYIFKVKGTVVKESR